MIHLTDWKFYLSLLIAIAVVVFVGWGLLTGPFLLLEPYWAQSVRGCFGRSDCATAVSSVILVFATGVLIWLTSRGSREARLLRQKTTEQSLLAALPILEVIFHRAPDKVFLHNTSATSAASRALLQGFRYTWNRNTWKCTFKPTGVISSNQEVALQARVEPELADPAHGGAIPGLPIFDVAFKRAFAVSPPDWTLTLLFVDMLGNCYRSEVTMDRSQFFVFADGHPEMRPPISRPVRVQIFPDPHELVDRTVSVQRSV